MTDTPLLRCLFDVDGFGEIRSPQAPGRSRQSQSDAGPKFQCGSKFLLLNSKGNLVMVVTIMILMITIVMLVLMLLFRLLRSYHWLRGKPWGNLQETLILHSFISRIKASTLAAYPILRGRGKKANEQEQDFL